MWLVFSKECLKWDEVRYRYSVFSGFIRCQWEILCYICMGACLCVCVCVHACTQVCVLWGSSCQCWNSFLSAADFSLLHSGSVPNFTQNRPLVALLDRRVSKVLDRSPQIDNRFQCLWFFYKHVHYDVFVSCHDQHSVLIPVHWKCRGADKPVAQPTSQCILFDGGNILFDASLVIYINSNNIPPIMIINRIYKNQNHLSL